jgi:hypothetical protein
MLRQSLEREKDDDDDKQKALDGSLHILLNALMDNSRLSYISKEHALKMPYNFSFRLIYHEAFPCNHSRKY